MKQSLAGIDAPVPVETVAGTAYTVVASDRNKIKRFTSATDVTLTFAAGLGALFAFSFIQRGEGEVVWQPASGVTIVNPNNHTKSVKNGMVSVFADTADNFIVQGATQQ